MKRTKGDFEMATITLHYDGRSASAKSLLEFLRTLSFVKVSEDKDPEYDPEFVAKIERSRKSKGKKIALDDLWK